MVSMRSRAKDCVSRFVRLICWLIVWFPPICLRIRGNIELWPGDRLLWLILCFCWRIEGYETG